MQHKGFLRTAALLLAALCVLAAFPFVFADAADSDVSPEPDYTVWILDDADLLTQEQEQTLTERMSFVTAYGHALLWTASESVEEDTEQIGAKLNALVGEDSAVIYIIDLYDNHLYSTQQGRLNELVTSSGEKLINDRVKQYCIDAIRGENDDGFYLSALELYEGLWRILQPRSQDSPDVTCYTNPETGFTVRIMDELDLLTSAEENALVQEMIPVAEFGHAIFWTTEEPTHGDERKQASRKLQALTGNDESCIFVINMNARKITLECHGVMERSMTSSKARSVTDNVSTYATHKDYYHCAAEAYRQVVRVLRGNRISEPMRYLSYGVLSLMLGLLFAALIVFGKKYNTLYKKNSQALSAKYKGTLSAVPAKAVKTRTDKVYLPVQSDSDSGGSFGGGGGGGGFSSSGGSSSF